MAFRYRVLSVEATDHAVTVRARYFDDAAPTVTLGRATLRLPADTTRVQARAAIIAEGKLLQAGIQARARLAPDVGTEGAVT